MQAQNTTRDLFAGDSVRVDGVLIGRVIRVDGEIQVGWRMKATISVDHRVSDGAEAARFMQALARYLEEPLRLML